MKLIRSALMLALFVSLPMAALAGTYTFNTTAAQDTQLERVRVHLNLVRAAQGLAPYATIQAMLSDELIDRLTDRLEQVKGREGSDFCTAWRTIMTRGQKDAVCVSPGVGLAAGCEVCK